MVPGGVTPSGIFKDTQGVFFLFLYPSRASAQLCGLSNYKLLKHIGQLPVLLSSQAYWKMYEPCCLGSERQTYRRTWSRNCCDLFQYQFPLLSHKQGNVCMWHWRPAAVSSYLSYLILSSIILLVLEHVAAADWINEATLNLQTRQMFRGPEDIRE